MKVGVVRFPGTNCDQDVLTMAQTRGHQTKWLWHLDRFYLQEVDYVILPGGFSYGDYLRCGAMAARSPVMDSVREFAAQGKPILGICNGFQILCESGLLPGVLLRNESQKFIDRWVDLRVENPSSLIGSGLVSGQKLRLPIAHGEGRYFIEKPGLEELRANHQIWLCYEGNPNGSLQDIAGIMNKHKNVAGLMPHPERAVWDWMGGVDGGNFL